MAKFYLFSKESCGPCMLVDRYMKSIKDERTERVEKVDLEDFGQTPTKEARQLAKQYGVTATPVLVIVDDEGTHLETFVGGLNITQNIRKKFDEYDI